VRVYADGVSDALSTSSFLTISHARGIRSLSFWVSPP
jgi:hypothetical protein